MSRPESKDKRFREKLRDLEKVAINEWHQACARRDSCQRATRVAFTSVAQSKLDAENYRQSLVAVEEARKLIGAVNDHKARLKAEHQEAKDWIANDIEGEQREGREAVERLLKEKKAIEEEIEAVEKQTLEKVKAHKDHYQDVLDQLEAKVSKLMDSIRSGEMEGSSSRNYRSQDLESTVGS